MSPYWLNARSSDAPHARLRGVRELLIPFAVIWIACVIHVGAVIARSAEFSSGDTLALALVVLLPWVLRAR